MNNAVNVGNARHAFEFLQLINDAETEDQRVALLTKWGAISPLNMLLSLNYNTNVELSFPVGAPPYERNESVHPDMCSPLASQIQRLKSCMKGGIIRQMDKERILLQVLEQIPFKEADVLIACKDRLLTDLYPNITADLVKKVFPIYVQ